MPKLLDKIAASILDNDPTHLIRSTYNNSFYRDNKESIIKLRSKYKASELVEKFKEMFPGIFEEYENLKYLRYNFEGQKSSNESSLLNSDFSTLSNTYFFIIANIKLYEYLTNKLTIRPVCKPLDYIFKNKHGYIYFPVDSSINAVVNNLKDIGTDSNGISELIKCLSSDNKFILVDNYLYDCLIITKDILKSSSSRNNKNIVYTKFLNIFVPLNEHSIKYFNSLSDRNILRKIKIGSNEYNKLITNMVKNLINVYIQNIRNYIEFVIDKLVEAIYKFNNIPSVDYVGNFYDSSFRSLFDLLLRTYEERCLLPKIIRNLLGEESKSKKKHLIDILNDFYKAFYEEYVKFRIEERSSEDQLNVDRVIHLYFYIAKYDFVYDRAAYAVKANDKKFLDMLSLDLFYFSRKYIGKNIKTAKQFLDAVLARTGFAYSSDEYLLSGSKKNTLLRFLYNNFDFNYLVNVDFIDLLFRVKEFIKSNITSKQRNIINKSISDIIVELMIHKLLNKDTLCEIICDFVSNNSETSHLYNMIYVLVKSIVKEDLTYQDLRIKRFDIIQLINNNRNLRVVRDIRTALIAVFSSYVFGVINNILYLTKVYHINHKNKQVAMINIKNINNYIEEVFADKRKLYNSFKLLDLLVDYRKNDPYIDNIMKNSELKKHLFLFYI